jgi:DNA topoisomerase III
MLSALLAFGLFLSGNFVLNDLNKAFKHATMIRLYRGKLVIVVITEKPSVARDLSAFLGAKQKRDGYFEGNGYQVTWAFGHLVANKDPQDYNTSWKQWTTDTLPIIPEKFELKCREDGSTKKQLSIIEQLIKKCKRLICATDAGREGELIFRNILRALHMESQPFERLWLSSLTNEAIAQAFEKLKPGTDYNNLYYAARCRSEADWIVGINGTRNLTVRFGRGILWSLGRVQTPVLAMLANRDDEIATFTPEPFWEIQTLYRDVVFKQTAKRFLEKEKAEAAFNKIKDQPFTVEKIQKKRERAFPPQLFDLTELQREMNKRHALSAADTLAAAQSLYESKLLTYPRTDSQYLSEDMKGKIPSIFNRLAVRFKEKVSALNLQKLPFSNRIINDKKVTDHHAIIPTGQLPSQLPPDQQKVYEAVVLRTLAVFYPPCEKDVTTIEGSSAKFPFRARGVLIVIPGWTVLYPSNKKEGDEQELPAFEKKESGPHDPSIKEGKTQPPKHFTENSLLGAMATAGKDVDDEELKEALKEKGLGTPATRASIIETLIQRQYLKRTKKNLTITSQGRYLIALIQDPQLKSAELTGEWEAKLKQIEYGKLSPRTFLEEIKTFTRQMLESSDAARFNPERLGPCPLCAAEVIQGSKGYGCSRWKEGCAFVLWKDYMGTHLRPLQAQKLIQKRILLDPIFLEEKEKVVLALTEKGKVIHLPIPAAPPRRKK